MEISGVLVLAVKGALDSSEHQTAGVGMSKMLSLLGSPWLEAKRFSWGCQASLASRMLSTWLVWGHVREAGLLINVWLSPEELFQETKAGDSRLLMTLQITQCYCTFTLILWIHRDKPYSVWGSLNTRGVVWKGVALQGELLHQCPRITNFLSLCLSVATNPYHIARDTKKTPLLSWFLWNHQWI